MSGKDAEIVRLREALFQCYKSSGADCGGAQHYSEYTTRPDIDVLAVKAVMDLRECYDELLNEKGGEEVSRIVFQIKCQSKDKIGGDEVFEIYKAISTHMVGFKPNDTQVVYDFWVGTETEAGFAIENSEAKCPSPQ